MALPVLRDLLDQHFNDEELRRLCFDLSIEYENLRGNTRIVKVQSLVEQCLRHNRLPALGERCRELCSAVAWPDTAALAADWAQIEEKHRSLDNLAGVLTDEQLAEGQSKLREQEAGILTQLIGGDWIGGDKITTGDITSSVVAMAGAQVNIAHITQVVAEDFWRRQPPRQQDLRPATAMYLQHILHRYRFLDFKGMGVSDRIPLQLPLDEMYVPLKARIEMPEGETWARQLKVAGREAGAAEIEAMGRRVSEPTPVLELLQKNKGLIILGDPGAGKTTFLKFLALQLALGQGEGLGLGQRLPVLLPLSAYANALARADVPLHRFIDSYYDKLGSDLPVGAMLAAALQQGRALFLMDGLDEVRDLGTRHLVVERVTTFFTFQQQRGNKFILTSRIVGYREVRPNVPDLAECTLVDFDDAEISLFVRKWTSALEKAAKGDNLAAQLDAAQERQDLLTALQHNPGVRRLAANPLLLTILALMKRQGVTLPERRVELYEQYVRTLLKHWNLARGLDGRAALDLDVVETVRALAPLALWMHETSPGVGLVKREALRRKLEAIYTARDEAEPAKATQALLDDAREYAGLLVERGQGMYGFIHLTFQEYLAAVAVAQKGQSDLQPVVDTLSARIEDDNWHEVTLLTIGYMGIVQQRDEAASDVLTKLREQGPGKAGAAVILAGEAVADVWPGGVTRQCRENVITALVDTLQDDRTVPAIRRAEAGRVLARLGDPRPGLGVNPETGLPDIAWGKEVPAETYTIGGGKAAYRSFDKRPVQIKQPYSLSRYPITNAQFQCFVDAADWDDPAWWEGLPEDEKQFDEPYFPYANHPRETVSWYQAVAFCRWLSDKLGEEIKLPHEYEWEVAARWDGKKADGRAYPWGDEFDKERANTDEGGVRQTTAVGLYPAGKNEALDLYDLSGNVWEWCRNKYDNPDDDTVDDSGGWRGLRGGSWVLNQNYARGAHRSLSLDLRYRNSGFRVAVVRRSPSHQAL